MKCSFAGEFCLECPVTEDSKKLNIILEDSSGAHNLDFRIQIFIDQRLKFLFKSDFKPGCNLLNYGRGMTWKFLGGGLWIQRPCEI